jgi:hypothetical protein
MIKKKKVINVSISEMRKYEREKAKSNFVGKKVGNVFYSVYNRIVKA